MVSIALKNSGPSHLILYKIGFSVGLTHSSFSIKLQNNLNKALLIIWKVKYFSLGHYFFKAAIWRKSCFFFIQATKGLINVIGYIEMFVILKNFKFTTLTDRCRSYTYIWRRTTLANFVKINRSVSICGSPGSIN